MPDRGRLRGRGQRVRLEGRERHLLREERRHDPPLAALARQGRRLGLPTGLERPLIRVDRRRPTRRADGQVRQGRRRVRHRVPARSRAHQPLQVRAARVPLQLHRRHPPHADLRGRLPDEAGQPALRNGHAHRVRQRHAQRDQRRHPRALGRAVPLRRARRCGRQRDQGRDLAPRGRPTGLRRPVLPEANGAVRRPATARYGQGRRPPAEAAARGAAGAADARPRDRPAQVLPAGRLPRTDSRSSPTRKRSICSRWPR